MVYPKPYKKRRELNVGIPVTNSVIILIFKPSFLAICFVVGESDSRKTNWGSELLTWKIGKIDSRLFLFSAGDGLRLCTSKLARKILPLRNPFLCLSGMICFTAESEHKRAQPLSLCSLESPVQRLAVCKRLLQRDRTNLFHIDGV